MSLLDWRLIDSRLINTSNVISFRKSSTSEYLSIWNLNLCFRLHLLIKSFFNIRVLILSILNFNRWRWRLIRTPSWSYSGWKILKDLWICINQTATNIQFTITKGINVWRLFILTTILILLMVTILIIVLNYLIILYDSNLFLLLLLLN